MTRILEFSAKTILSMVCSSAIFLGLALYLLYIIINGIKLVSIYMYKQCKLLIQKSPETKRMTTWAVKIVLIAGL